MVKPLQPSSEDLDARRRQFQRREQTRDRMILASVLLGTIGVALLTAALIGGV